MRTNVCRCPYRQEQAVNQCQWINNFGQKRECERACSFREGCTLVYSSGFCPLCLRFDITSLCKDDKVWLIDPDLDLMPRSRFATLGQTDLDPIASAYF